jgi:diguanylate cyclase (GGDEF)-like protein
MFLNTDPVSRTGAGADHPHLQGKMSENGLPIDTDALASIARETGLAVALVDSEGHEFAAANNNSICRSLNPGGEFSSACARFCGRAFDKAFEVGKPIGFVCHAGLDCRAIAVADADKPLVAIIGRTFLKSENYKKATERAIIGDWREFRPSDFFENILLTGSTSVLDGATRRVAKLIAENSADRHEQPSTAVAPVEHELKADAQPAVRQMAVEVEASRPTPPRVSGVSAWRSFFGSILKHDYPRATESLLRFLAGNYGLTNLVWLETEAGRLEHTAGLGEVNGKKARLGIRADDARLVEAFRNELPLELDERGSDANGKGRVMRLFPIGVDGEVTAAIAVLDPIKPDDSSHIARVCHSVAHQFEILRLRHNASENAALTAAIRELGEGLKEIDTDDPWQGLTQKTAEILKAERASLLLFNDKTGSFDIKALIGAKQQPGPDEEAGTRVARIVFAKKQAVVVADVTRTGLPPAPPERGYKTNSFLSCPITVGARTIGVMSFADRASGLAFDRRSVELYQAIAPQLAVAVDHAALKEKAGEFEQLSVTDALTGLLNRRYIEARLLEEIQRSNRHGFPMSFMMLDVDHFKSYNDEFGHPAGDEALRMVGTVIRQTLRGADVAARFGGEEFAILLPQTTAEEAAAIAERIRANIQNAEFRHRRVTASIGVASCSAELCVSADIVSAADKALYDAKRGGRNRVQAFENLNGGTPA